MNEHRSRHHRRFIEFDSFDTFDTPGGMSASTATTTEVPTTVAEVLRRHWCTPGCIAAVSGPRGCRCACRGRFHGQAATVLLTNMTGGAS